MGAVENLQGALNRNPSFLESGGLVPTSGRAIHRGPRHQTVCTK